MTQHERNELAEKLAELSSRQTKAVQAVLLLLAGCVLEHREGALAKHCSSFGGMAITSADPVEVAPEKEAIQ